jgi:hypothetical protein
MRQSQNVNVIALRHVVERVRESPEQRTSDSRLILGPELGALRKGSRDSGELGVEALGRWQSSVLKVPRLNFHVLGTSLRRKHDSQLQTRSSRFGSTYPGSLGLLEHLPTFAEHVFERDRLDAPRGDLIHPSPHLGTPSGVELFLRRPVTFTVEQHRYQLCPIDLGQLHDGLVESEHVGAHARSVARLGAAWKACWATFRVR